MTDMTKASPAVQNAVLKVVHADMEKIIDAHMGSGLAAMFHDRAQAMLDGTEGRAMLLQLVNHALDAEAHARGAEQMAAGALAKPAVVPLKPVVSAPAPAIKVVPKK